MCLKEWKVKPSSIRRIFLSKDWQTSTNKHANLTVYEKPCRLLMGKRRFRTQAVHFIEVRLATPRLDEGVTADEGDAYPARLSTVGAPCFYERVTDSSPRPEIKWSTSVPRS